MNERIKELAEQALENSLFETIEPTITVGDGENKVTIPLVFAKNLAELIVKECIAQCEKNAEHSYLGPGSKLCAFNIKEHFGFE